ncbi:hypothetical protein AAFC00_000117 [Neodothiora populina]|uniref:FAD-binding FR-type domain-containing protein n=1 Tax=Neodothiora populina TaxID=2781224 RepID=A0ABR3P1U0_9PEZI
MHPESVLAMNSAIHTIPHTTCPTTRTSHPDNPIPTEPTDFDQKMALHTKSSFASSQSPRSSSASLVWSEVPSESSSESDAASITTPSCETADEFNDFTTPKGQKASHSDAAVEAKSSGPRRGSTVQMSSNVQDIQKLLGDGETGTKFLQKFCCGGGCCKVQAIPPDTTQPGFRSVQPPDNAAFRALNLKIDLLTLDTGLSNIVDLPESNMSIIQLAEPVVEEHKITKAQIHPPEFVQPHPPHSVFSAPVFHARSLTKEGAEKRTIHFDIDVTDYPDEGDVDFKVGGAVGICPPNDPDIVDDIFNQLGLPKHVRDKPITLKTKGGRWPTIWGEDEPRELHTTRRELLTWCADISSTAPTKQLFRLLAEYASEPTEKKILMYLASAQGQAAFCDLRTGPNLTLSHLLHAFPSSRPPLEALLTQLNQLMPRFYSLSNDPHVSSDRQGLAGRRLIEVAVTVHEAQNWDGSHRTGIGSGYLERVARQFVTAEKKAKESGNQSEMPDLRIPMFRGLMANPLSKKFDSDGPMIMIGAGVGMAPFRGFILNRLRNSKCANKIWLIQGIRDSMLDEIYSGELGDNEKEIKKVVQSRARAPPVDEQDAGVVSISPTESEGGGKVVSADKANQVAKYVQDEVRFQADIVWFVSNAIDGRIFVCGSSRGMGEGVHNALVDVAMDKGGMNKEEAEEFWTQKAESGQYVAVS